MLDHGQLGPATPATLSPTVSRRPSTNKPRTSSFTQSIGGLGDSLSMSSIKDDVISEDASESEEHNEETSNQVIENPSEPDASTAIEDASIASSLGIGQTLSNSIITPPIPPSNELWEKLAEQANDPNAQKSLGKEESLPPTNLMNPTDLTKQLLSNPKLAALRSSSSIPQVGDGAPPPATSSSMSGLPSFSSPPILMNPKCSGYFVEPVRLHRALGLYT